MIIPRGFAELMFSDVGSLIKIPLKRRGYDVFTGSDVLNRKVTKNTANRIDELTLELFSRQDKYYGGGLLLNEELRILQRHDMLILKRSPDRKRINIVMIVSLKKNSIYLKLLVKHPSYTGKATKAISDFISVIKPISNWYKISKINFFNSTLNSKTGKSAYKNVPGYKRGTGMHASISLK